MDRGIGWRKAPRPCLRRTITRAPRLRYHICGRARIIRGHESRQLGTAQRHGRKHGRGERRIDTAAIGGDPAAVDDHDPASAIRSRGRPRPEPVSALRGGHGAARRGRALAGVRGLRADRVRAVSRPLHAVRDQGRDPVATEGPRSVRRASARRDGRTGHPPRAAGHSSPTPLVAMAALVAVGDPAPRDRSAARSLTARLSPRAESAEPFRRAASGARRAAWSAASRRDARRRRE